MATRLIIEGNSVYEIDEECERIKNSERMGKEGYRGRVKRMRVSGGENKDTKDDKEVRVKIHDADG